MKSLLDALQQGRLVELPDTDKEQSLVFLAHLIEAIPDLGTGADLVESVLARERSANTGLGHGVACPHVRASGGGELWCAVGWSPSGIDYGSPDGVLVHLVVMYYIPDALKNLYLKEVSGLAGAVMKAGGVQAVADAKDLGAVRDRLLDWVSAAIEASAPEARARMIRLEARQAAAEAAPVVVGEKPLVAVVAAAFLALDDARHVVLCQDAELAAALEKADGLGTAVRRQSQFELAGYRLFCRSATAYEGGRTLYDYLAVKVL